mmetsp:Transcript_160532/g.515300  ORF Transcript_160532/g.515300 Transcript_160532/m.515300 type:complete len:288 (+) Transcript_160532:347-1210(+)
MAASPLTPPLAVAAAHRTAGPPRAQGASPRGKLDLARTALTEPAPACIEDRTARRGRPSPRRAAAGRAAQWRRQARNARDAGARLAASRAASSPTSTKIRPVLQSPSAMSPLPSRTLQPMVRNLMWNESSPPVHACGRGWRPSAACGARSAVWPCRPRGPKLARSCPRTQRTFSSACHPMPDVSLLPTLCRVCRCRSAAAAAMHAPRTRSKTELHHPRRRLQRAMPRLRPSPKATRRTALRAPWALLRKRQQSQHHRSRQATFGPETAPHGSQSHPAKCRRRCPHRL